MSFCRSTRTLLAVGNVERIRRLHLVTTVQIRVVERRPKHERVQRTVVVARPVQQSDFARLTAAGVEFGAVRMTVVALLAGNHARFALFDAQLCRAADLGGKEARAEQHSGHIGGRLKVGAVGGSVGNQLAGRAALADHRCH